MGKGAEVNRFTLYVIMVWTSWETILAADLTWLISGPKVGLTVGWSSNSPPLSGETRAGFSQQAAWGEAVLASGTQGTLCGPPDCGSQEGLAWSAEWPTNRTGVALGAWDVNWKHGSSEYLVNTSRRWWAVALAFVEGTKDVGFCFSGAYVCPYLWQSHPWKWVFGFVTLIHRGPELVFLGLWTPDQGLSKSSFFFKSNAYIADN